MQWAATATAIQVEGVEGVKGDFNAKCLLVATQCFNAKAQGRKGVNGNDGWFRDVKGDFKAKGLFVAAFCLGFNAKAQGGEGV